MVAFVSKLKTRFKSPKMTTVTAQALRILLRKSFMHAEKTFLFQAILRSIFTRYDAYYTGFDLCSLAATLDFEENVLVAGVL